MFSRLRAQACDSGGRLLGTVGILVGKVTLNFIKSSGDGS